MLDKIVSAFQGFFSRAFWFANFLPVALAGAIHLTIAWLYDPKIVPLPEWLQAKAEMLVLLPVAFALLVLLSYLLAPLVPLMRGLLDGSLLPLWFHDALRRHHVVAVRAERTLINDALQTSTALRRIRDSSIARLQAAFRKSMETDRVDHPDLIETAERDVEALSAAVRYGEAPDSPIVQQAVASVERALEVNALRPPPNTPNEQLAGRLFKANELLSSLLDQAHADAEYRYKTLVARNKISITIKVPQATRMADARMYIERYSAHVYKADFDYLWPRLQLMLREAPAEGAKDSFGSRFADAQSNVNFAVLSLALVLTVPIVWLPILAASAGSPWLFLSIGIGTPFLILFFYEMAVQTQIAFGDFVKAAIDDHRTALLKRLRQPVPATLRAERDLWHRLSGAEQAPELFDLVYRDAAPKQSE